MVMRQMVMRGKYCKHSEDQRRPDNKGIRVGKKHRDFLEQSRQGNK